MAKKIANNWKCSKEAQHFFYRYLKPMNKRFDEFRDMMLKTSIKKTQAQRDADERKFLLMDIRNVDFHTFYHSTLEMAEQHENLVTLLAQMYSRWYNKVSVKGSQSKEMMSMQASELHEMFSELFEALKPLELDLKPPKGDKYK